MNKAVIAGVIFLEVLREASRRESADPSVPECRLLVPWSRGRRPVGGGHEITDPCFYLRGCVIAKASGFDGLDGGCWYRGAEESGCVGDRREVV